MALQWWEGVWILCWFPPTILKNDDWHVICACVHSQCTRERQLGGSVLFTYCRIDPGLQACLANAFSHRAVFPAPKVWLSNFDVMQQEIGKNGTVSLWLAS